MAALPVPRMEALLYCRTVTIEDGGARTIHDVGDRVTVIGSPPFNVSGFVFARYFAAPGAHTAELRLVDLENGAIVARFQPPAGVQESSTGGVVAVTPISFEVQSVGMYALQLLLNDNLIGTSGLGIGFVERGGLR